MGIHWDGAVTPEVGTPQWYAFDIVPSVPVLADTAYYIVIRVSPGHDYVDLSWSAQWPDGPGGALMSEDNGVTWQTWALYSLNFEVLGVETRNPARPDTDLPAYPPDRPDDYAPDSFWIPDEWDGDTYTPPEWSSDPIPGRYFATGGGRWGQQLVVAGNNLVYYSELT
jgi:hypothetical protein